jgi:hypothetical protein
MNQSEVEAFVAQLEDVQREENFGYIFLCCMTIVWRL